MSMLTRKGTMVRKNRGSLKRQSVRRQGNGSITRKQQKTTSEMPESPRVIAVKQQEFQYPQSSPTRSVASTIVSFDDEKQLCKTSIDWRKNKQCDQEPQYEAIMIQIQEANKEAENTCDFICRSSKIMCHTVLVTVIVGLSMALPITMMSVGVKYLNECPKQKKVPVYLLVGGCFGMLKVLGTIWRNIRYRRYDDMDSFYDGHGGDGAFAAKTYHMMDMIISTFLLAWLIAGTYWVFEIWQPHYKQLLHEPSNWCDKHVYMFAVYQIIGCYAFLAFLLLTMCVLASCYKFTNIFDHS
ncbi:transmembrane protein 272-like [Mytilus trossulus]|uniref:transmembrane protein 272-like n=1 Tax=Mytilus trossulus TaxID=6551 RepID=UPI003007680E